MLHTLRQVNLWKHYTKALALKRYSFTRGKQDVRACFHYSFQAYCGQVLWPIFMRWPQWLPRRHTSQQARGS